MLLVATPQTVRLASTNEVATYSNGSLASSRVINVKRSEKAIVAIYLKFNDETKYEKLEIFLKTVEKVRTGTHYINLLGTNVSQIDCIHSAFTQHSLSKSVLENGFPFNLSGQLM